MTKIREILKILVQSPAIPKIYNIGGKCEKRAPSYNSKEGILVDSKIVYARVKQVQSMGLIPQ